MTLSRRAFALLPIALAASGPGLARAATLPAPASLADELARALAQGKPLVVMASLHRCPFCNTVRNQHLLPLHRESALPVVQIDMGSTHEVVGFDGRRQTHAQLLQAWGVRVAPTVLFFGTGAREVAARLEGASIPDFYGAYLDERLETARRSIAAATRAKPDAAVTAPGKDS